jgi:hypothetical protein
MPEEDKPQLKVRNTEIRTVRVGDILDNELNHRTHSDVQRETFDAAVQKIGWFGYPDVFETGTGELKLIDGELRKHDLLAHYGEDALIEVNVTDFNENEARTALLTKDALAQMAGANAEMLKELIQEQTEQEGTLADFYDEMAREYDIEWQTAELQMDDDAEEDEDDDWGWDDDGQQAGGTDGHIRMLVLYLTEATVLRFHSLAQSLFETYGVDNASEAAAIAVKRQTAKQVQNDPQ